MLIQYNGPHPEVVVDEFNSEQVIVNGQPVEIPDGLAVRLLDQDTWASATAEPNAQQAADLAAAQAADAAAKAADAKVAADARTIDASPAADTTTKGNS